MAVIVDIQYAIESDKDIPKPDMFERWVQASYLLDNTDDVFVNIKIVDENESAALNEQYRQKSKSTNVLSFPMDMPVESPETILGDIAICAAIVKVEAQEQQKNIEAHWAHMVIHGMLHLQGYDHLETTEAIRMEDLERNIMAEFNYSDPYVIQD